MQAGGVGSAGSSATGRLRHLPVSLSKFGEIAVAVAATPCCWSGQSRGGGVCGRALMNRAQATKNATAAIAGRPRGLAICCGLVSVREG